MIRMACFAAVSLFIAAGCATKSTDIAPAYSANSLFQLDLSSTCRGTSTVSARAAIAAGRPDRIEPTIRLSLR